MDDVKDVLTMLIGVIAVVLFSLMCIGIGEWCSSVVYRMGAHSVAAGSTAFLVGLVVNLVVCASVVDRLANNRWWWK